MSLDGSTDWYLLSLVHILQTKPGHTRLLWRETISSWGSSKIKSLPKAPISLGPIPSTGLWENQAFISGMWWVTTSSYGRSTKDWGGTIERQRMCCPLLPRFFVVKENKSSRAASTISAHLKIHIEPENHPIEKENTLPNLHFWVPCRFSGVSNSSPKFALFFRPFYKKWWKVHTQKRHGKKWSYYLLMHTTREGSGCNMKMIHYERDIILVRWPTLIVI